MQCRVTLFLAVCIRSIEALHQQLPRHQWSLLFGGSHLNKQLAVALPTSLVATSAASAADAVDSGVMMSNGYEEAGKLFFLAYVVVSILAGVKEGVVRGKAWLEEKNRGT